MVIRTLPALLILNFHIIFHVAAEINGGFAGVLVIITEIDHIAGAEVGTALAAQRFGVYWKQKLLRPTDTDVLVVAAVSTLYVSRPSRGPFSSV